MSHRKIASQKRKPIRGARTADRKDTVLAMYSQVSLHFGNSQRGDWCVQDQEARMRRTKWQQEQHI
eukprot:jgi/Antlo1/201/549